MEGPSHATRETRKSIVPISRHSREERQATLPTT